MRMWKRRRTWSDLRAVYLRREWQVSEVKRLKRRLAKGREKPRQRSSRANRGSGSRGNWQGTVYRHAVHKSRCGMIQGAGGTFGGLQRQYCGSNVMDISCRTVLDPGVPEGLLPVHEPCFQGMFDRSWSRRAPQTLSSLHLINLGRGGRGPYSILRGLLHMVYTFCGRCSYCGRAVSLSEPSHPRSAAYARALGVGGCH